jgi:sirohydrochlorin cobaltochelatase
MTTAVQRPGRLPVEDMFVFGEVLVRPLPNGHFELCHREEPGSSGAGQSFQSAEDALELARFDDEGNYRPLKTAPNLRRGWKLELDNEENLRRALDFFYPGRLAVWSALNAKSLRTTPLRETLGRQTGMYKVAANISDEQLDCLLAGFCRSDGGCLRTILWKRDANGTIPSAKLPPEKYDAGYDQALTGGAEPIGANVPLLCQESCNLLVAECRKVVKGERTAS